MKVRILDSNHSVRQRTCNVACLPVDNNWQIERVVISSHILGLFTYEKLKVKH